MLCWRRELKHGTRVGERTLGLGVDDGAWVHLEVAHGKGTCRLRVRLSDDTPRDVVNTGMGWWLASDPAPEHGALDVNINAAPPSTEGHASERLKPNGARGRPQLPPQAVRPQRS